MQRGLYILIFLFSFVESGVTFAQDSEQLLSQTGAKLFSDEDYVAATPYYSQLLALQPRNPEYNYKYGACLLYNASNKRNAIKYLEFATANEEVNSDAFYFMGKAYHLNYQFEKAISFYNSYILKSKGKSNKAWEVDRQIQSCQNGKQLLKNISDIIVIEKKSVLESSFYSAYNLTELKGDILISDADQSKVDKKKGHRPLIYFPPNAKRVFFGSYGNSETTGKDIYVKEKNPDGSWSKPELVKGEVNSEYDEDFPFMDVINGYLYFSSKGHNSMGGYDIFKSKYNAATNTFGKPENLDFAISSTDNDIFYIKDDSDEFAWFASSRQSNEGKIDVYKVKVERVPAPIAAVQGTFNSILHPENKKMNIEVRDLSSNRIIGTYYTDDKGNYLISFPKSGKYEYTINVFGTPTPFKEIVEISASQQMNLMKQKLVHSEKANQELVEVIPVLDADLADEATILAAIMQSKAELNPNEKEFKTNKSINSAETESILAALNMNKMSAFEALSKTQELLSIQRAERSKNELLQQKSFQIILENNREINALQLEVKNAVAKTHGDIEKSEKKKLLNQASEAISLIQQFEENNKELLAFADSIQKSTNTLTVSASELDVLENDLKTAHATNDEAFFKVLAKNTSLLQELQVQNQSLKQDLVRSEIVSLTEAENKNKAIIKAYEVNVKSLKSEIQLLEEKKAAAKSKKQAEVQVEIDAKENDLGLIETEIRNVQQKDQLNHDFLQSKNKQLALLQQVEKESRPATKRNKTAVEQELKASDNQNFRTLKAYVAQQQAEIDSSTALAKNAENTEDELNPEHEVASETISENNTTNTSENNTAAKTEIQNSNDKQQEQRQEQEKIGEESTVEQKAIRGYEAEIAKIESNTNLSAEQKGEAILKTEIDLQRNLALDLVKVEKTIAENPEDQNAVSQYEMLVDELEKSENRASEQAQMLVAAEVERLDADKLLSKLDPSYSKDIQKIEKSKSSTKTTERIERENRVQRQLKEKIEINQKIINPTNSISVLAENQVLLNLIEASVQRVDSLQAFVETDVVENEFVETGIVENKEFSAQPADFRAITLGDNATILFDDFDSESELIAQQTAIFKYLDVLEKRLSELRTQNQAAPTEAIQADFDWTISELETVEDKLAEIAKELTAIKEEKLLVNEDFSASENLENSLVETETALETSKEITADPLEVEKSVEPEYFAQNESFRTSALQESISLLNADLNTEAELINQQETLTEYQDALTVRLADLTTQAKTNASLALQNDLDWTIDEFETVERKLTTIAKRLNAINAGKEAANSQAQLAEKLDSEEDLQVVESEKEDELAIRENFNPTPSNQENTKTESLESVQNLNTEIQQTIAELKGKSSESGLAQLNNLELINQKLTEEAAKISKIKEEELKSKMLSKLAQEQLGLEEQLAELEREQLYSELVQSPKNTSFLKANELETLSRLENKQRRFRIEIGELTSTIEQLDVQIARLNKIKAKNLVLERSQKQALKTLLEADLIEMEEVLAARKSKTPAAIDTEIALKQVVTLEDERQTAQTNEYKALQAEYKELVDQNAEIKQIQTDLESRRREIETFVTESQTTESILSTNSIDENLSQINALNASLAKMEKQRAVSQQAFNENIQNTANSALIQNLLARGVTPITTSESKAKALVFTAFKILTPTEKTTRTPIVVDDDKPLGLVYRVQVGAFSKPINETLFSEFTPVSGEKLNNGITRYMVGYFNNREAVMNALLKIRKIGYADAFPVAYCDGERITMFEAKRLEDAGLCVAQGTDELAIQEHETVVENANLRTDHAFVENKDLNQSDQQEKAQKQEASIIDEVSQNQAPIVEKVNPKETLSPENEKLAAYNKAPGAAVASAVETRLGLFFTVQIGVYNKPVPASQLFNIVPLITQRLENGQVRYSTGVFHSIPDARPKREEAVLLGISDAYITAYYQGKRISIQEAREVLAKEGEGVLEPVKVIENKVLTAEELTVVENEKIQEEELLIDKVKENLETSKLKVQFVSKKQFDHFPLDVIKRYNQKGDFYYDIKDQRVKSIIYNASNLPSIYGFKDDVDTLIVRTKTRQEVAEELIIKVVYKDASLPGDVGDWLLRFGYLRELKVLDDRIQLTVFGITDPIDYDFLLNDLKSLGFESIPENQE